MQNSTIKQYLLIGAILLLVYTIGAELFAFFPGLLGAITLYILMRRQYFRLTVVKHWRKGFTAAIFIIACIILFVLPITAMV